VSNSKEYKLLGADGQFYMSLEPGTLGGYSKKKIYGRLDCPSALNAIKCGGYVPYRVFFKDEETAIAAGYRPCGTCLPEKYEAWKKAQEQIKIQQLGFGVKIDLQVKHGYKFFWLKGISKAQIDKCRAECFTGENYPTVYNNTRREGKSSVSLNIAPLKHIKAFYLCGVSSRYEDNVHIAFVPEKGSSFSIENSRYRVNVTNAREIHFQSYKPNPDGEYTDEQRSCRNWIFANYLKDGMPL